jgi:hypothetical protein
MVMNANKSYFRKELQRSLTIQSRLLCKRLLLCRISQRWIILPNSVLAIVSCCGSEEETMLKIN